MTGPGSGGPVGESPASGRPVERGPATRQGQAQERAAGEAGGRGGQAPAAQALQVPERAVAAVSRCVFRRGNAIASPEGAVS